MFSNNGVVDVNGDFFRDVNRDVFKDVNRNVFQCFEVFHVIDGLNVDVT